MITTIIGSNEYMAKHELATFVSNFIETYDEMAVEHLDGDEDSFERILEAVQALPFLTPRKLVVLRNPGRQKLFTEKISEVLVSVPENTDVIIYEAKIDKRSTYYKTLKKQTDYHDYPDMDGPTLINWIKDYVTIHGGIINSSDATLLINRVGSNQLVVKNELDKLLIFDPTITRQNILLLTEAAPQSTVFELLDAAFSGDLSKVFELYKEQRALKVEPQAIIAMLAWQLHILALVKAAEKLPIGEMASQTKLSPFVLRKSQALARRLTHAQLKQLISLLLELDTQLKSSSIDAEQALKYYFLSLGDTK